MYIDNANDFISDDINVACLRDSDILLQVTKSELETIKEALYEAAVNRDLLKAQRFGVLNRTIEDYLKQDKGDDDYDYLPF